MIYADLHTHSNCSDGVLSPSELVVAAKKAGLSAVALTDHDGVAGLAEARCAALNNGVELVDGIEFSAKGRCAVHIIGLFVEPDNAQLRGLIAESAAKRQRRNDALIAKLNDLGFDVRVSPKGGGATVTKANIARELVKSGRFADIGEAIEKYMDPGAPAYVPAERPRPEDAIAAIKAAGGLSVLCHLNRIKAGFEEIRLLVGELKGFGLDALETEYFEYDVAWREKSAALAKSFSLLQSGGSDFHGGGKPAVLGGAGVGKAQFDRLKSAAARPR